MQLSLPVIADVRSDCQSCTALSFQPNNFTVPKESFADMAALFQGGNSQRIAGLPLLGYSSADEIAIVSFAVYVDYLCRSSAIQCSYGRC